MREVRLEAVRVTIEDRLHIMRGEITPGDQANLAFTLKDCSESAGGCGESR